MMSTQSTVVKRSARAGSAMMKSAVTSAISRELQCNQQLIVEVSEKNDVVWINRYDSVGLRAKIQQMLFALITTSRKVPVARYQSQGTSRRVYLSQDDEPVAGYNAPSRRLQCFAYPVAGNPDERKADVVKRVANQMLIIATRRKESSRSSRRYNQ
ncbi:hypothetical protein F511_29375 [Dorcoceras hygrometricum]|uniref:Uncharacterized protein n=1 Tax=Dorcoceras hygrometricum TaxID=472368 RepID=A0A2Z7AID0_9LAMI|nr:hypothetical protein F511_29375 [Dorcoceras hygrometricum]